MSLFMSYKLASLALNNRIVMAPMTRARTMQPGNIPNDLMAQYYAQRASAGLIITEATQISDDSQGYSFTPGVYTAEQIEGWKKSLRRCMKQAVKSSIKSGMLAVYRTRFFSRVMPRLRHQLLRPLALKYGLWMKPILKDKWWIAQNLGLWCKRISTALWPILHRRQ